MPSPLPANNPSFPDSLFPNAVDVLSNQPDAATAAAIMAIESSLIGGATGGAPSAPGMPSFTSNGIVTGGQLVSQNGMTLMTNYGAGATHFYCGTGVPTGANVPGNGVNGDYYFRNDTPGTANQRIYVKSAGAWVGIV